MAGTEIVPEMGFGPYPVTMVKHFNLTLKDGVPIAMKIWIPWKLGEMNSCFVNEKWGIKWFTEIYRGKPDELTLGKEDKFPSIVEYIPYRKDDWTSERDHARHSWFASHGFVCVRPDIRGSGSSGGYYFDEYEPQEQSDCIEIIEWLAKQYWSNGKVGMFGKSWGGFNGLQVAYNQPEPLKAVISLYSSDDRFNDDIFYNGGCVIGNGLPLWCSQMFVWNARPPDPHYFDTLDSWKNAWRYRLQHAVDCWSKLKLKYQIKDTHWSHGSISEDYQRVQCPILVIGGLEDGYTTSAFRMVAKLNEHTRGIIGPWDHDWPDCAHPGPQIDFLNTCLQWWKFHLKEPQLASQNVIEWPRLRLFIKEGHEPKEYYDKFDGSWINIPNWNELYRCYESENISSCNLIQFFLTNDQQLSEQKMESDKDVSHLLKPHPMQGANAGEWCPFSAGEIARDQSEANQHSLCFQSKPLQKEIAVVGFCKAQLMLSIGKSGIQGIAVRLCHQHPNGKSTRISYAIHNLGNQQEGYHVNAQVELKPTAYVVPKGHKLTLVISPTYFPTMLTLPVTQGISLFSNQSSLLIQTLNPTQLEDKTAFDKPLPRVRLNVETKTPSYPGVYWNCADEKDSLEDSIRFKSGYQDGPKLYPLSDLEVTESMRSEFKTKNDSSETEITYCREYGMNYKDVGANIRISTIAELRTNAQEFQGNDKLEVTVNDEKLFDRSWKYTIPREHA